MSETPPPIGMDRFQHEVGTWAEATFPLASDLSICIHLGREVSELRAWATSPDRDYAPMVLDNLVEEAADCLLLLLHLAYRNGFSLVDAAWLKFAINQSRRWGTPDTEGVVEHIEGAVQS